MWRNTHPDTIMFPNLLFFLLQLRDVVVKVVESNECNDWVLVVSAPVERCVWMVEILDDLQAKGSSNYKHGDVEHRTWFKPNVFGGSGSTTKLLRDTEPVVSNNQTMLPRRINLFSS